LLACLPLGLLMTHPCAAAEEPTPATDSAPGPGAAEVSVQPPMSFENPDAAVMALIDAAASEDRDALLDVLGSDLDALGSGDPSRMPPTVGASWSLSKEAAHLEDETDDSAILVIGPEDWPFPIPLAKDDQGLGISIPGPGSKSCWTGASDSTSCMPSRPPAPSWMRSWNTRPPIRTATACGPTRGVSGAPKAHGTDSIGRRTRASPRVPWDPLVADAVAMRATRFARTRRGGGLTTAISSRSSRPKARARRAGPSLISWMTDWRTVSVCSPGLQATAIPGS
jgi:hypothetical protein